MPIFSQISNFNRYFFFYNQNFKRFDKSRRGKISYLEPYKDNDNYTVNTGFLAVMDSSTRPEHAMLNGLVYRYDDPFWNSFYPPNGWNCRCRVNALSDYKLKEKKLSVYDSNGHLSEEMRLVSKKSGEYKPVTVYTDPLTGKKIAPDVGWSYNPASGLNDD